MDTPRRKKHRWSRDAGQWLLVILFLAAIVAAFIFLGPRIEEGLKRHDWKAHEVIGLAIFFGLLSVAGAIERVADALKKDKPYWIDTPESKAIKELAQAIDRVRTHGVKVDREAK